MENLAPNCHFNFENALTIKKEIYTKFYFLKKLEKYIQFGTNARFPILMMFTEISVLLDNDTNGTIHQSTHLTYKLQRSLLMKFHTNFHIVSRKYKLLVFGVRCRILSRNHSKECECVMEFPLIHFNVLKQPLSGYDFMQKINCYNP